MLLLIWNEWMAIYVALLLWFAYEASMTISEIVSLITDWRMLNNHYSFPYIHIRSYLYNIMCHDFLNTELLGHIWRQCPRSSLALNLARLLFAATIFPEPVQTYRHLDT